MLPIGGGQCYTTLANFAASQVITPISQGKLLFPEARCPLAILFAESSVQLSIGNVLLPGFSPLCRSIIGHVALLKLIRISEELGKY